jgi:hypothetical protein
LQLPEVCPHKKELIKTSGCDKHQTYVKGYNENSFIRLMFLKKIKLNHVERKETTQKQEK